MTRLFNTVLDMSMTASWVILVILFLRLPLRRAPKRYSYLLWIVAAFRLACPVSFQAAFSLFRLSHAATQGAVPQTVLSILPATGAMSPGIAAVSITELPAAAAPAASLAWSALDAAALVWCAGLASLLIWAAVSYLALRRRMGTAVLLEGNVYQSDWVSSPFILGFARPRIYIPFGLEGETLGYVLAHERHHLKRRDHMVKLFSFVLLAIHWFNPLCWLAFHQMARDMEMSCDEAVLSGEQNIRKAYSGVLLSFAAGRRFPSPSPLAFGESGVKARVKNTLRWKRPKVWVTLLAAALCIAVIAACAANPAKSVEGSPYQWTSRVQAGEVDLCAATLWTEDQEYQIVLTDSQLEELISLLNTVPAEAVYTGRGIPGQMSVTLHCGEGEYLLRYGGGFVELDFDSETARQFGEGIWEIHDGALSAFLEELMVSLASEAPAVDDGTVDVIWRYAPDVQEESTETVISGDVRWEYVPHLSSQYPAFPFQFNLPFSYTHIEVSCTLGGLGSFVDDSGSRYLLTRSTGGGPEGQTLTLSPGNGFYWYPQGGNSFATILPSTEITFTVFNNEEALYTATLAIQRLDLLEDGLVTAAYSASLTGCPALALVQNGEQGGGVVTFTISD